MLKCTLYTVRCAVYTVQCTTTAIPEKNVIPWGKIEML